MGIIVESQFLQIKKKAVEVFAAMFEGRSSHLLVPIVKPLGKSNSFLCSILDG